MTRTHEPEISAPIPHWQHQLDAYDFIYDKPGSMLAMSMGTGKSRVVIDIHQNMKFGRTLIICGKRVVTGHTWKKQFDLYSVVNPTILELGEGAVPKRAYEMKRALELQAVSGQPLVVVVNYDSVWRAPIGQMVMNAGFDLVVLDESHRAKAPGGKASFFLGRLGKITKKRIAATGTPMAHTPMDIYAQYRFLDPTIFGTSFASFRSRYAVMDQRIVHRIAGYINQNELNKKFYQIAFKVGDEVLDLPDYEDIERTFELRPSARKVYREIDKNLYAEIAGGEVVPANAMVKALRLQQFTGGYITVEGGKRVRVDDGKEDLLKEILEDIDVNEPVVIFGKFHEDLDCSKSAATRAGRQHVAELSGRIDELGKFESGASNTLVVQIQAGSEGINTMVRACYCIYYSVGTSLKDFEQSKKRVHRPGQTRPVTYIYLIAEHTRDRVIYKALKEHKDVIAAILDDMKKDYKEMSDAEHLQQVAIGDAVSMFTEGMNRDKEDEDEDEEEWEDDE